MAASAAGVTELEKLKAEVRAILLPSKDGTMLKSLEHEYADMVGRPLHFRQFGFGRLEDLLASMPDAVQLIRLNNGELLLKAVASKSTQHIASMVNRQKPAENSASRAVKAAKNDQYRAHNYRVQGTKLIPAAVQKQVLDLLKKFPNGLRSSDFLERFYQLHGVRLSHREWGYESVDEFLGELSKTLLRIRPIGRSGEIDVVPKEELLRQWDLEARSLASQQEAARSGGNVVGVEREDISIPPKLRESLTKLIEKRANGLWIKDLVKEYRAEYGCEFDYGSFGCISMIEFCARLPSIFKVVPASSNSQLMMLFPASIPEPKIVGAQDGGQTRDQSRIPDAVKSNLSRVLQRQDGGVALERVVRVYTETVGQVLDVSAYGFHNIVDFLKTLDFVRVDRQSAKDGSQNLVVRYVPPRHSTHLQPVVNQPVSAAGISERISRYPQGVLLGNPSAIAEQEVRLKVGDTFDVDAGEVVNPGHFYVQLRGPQTSDAIEKLMKRMDKYYNGIASNHLRVPETVPPVGNFFAAEYQTFGWHRAFVSRMIDPEHVEVFYIDYGTKEKKALKELRLLHEHFGALPAQAIQARLAGVRPPKGAAKWSVDASLKFFELIQKCGAVGMVAVLKGLKREKSRTLLSVDLYDTSGDGDDIFINKVLQTNGLAAVDDNAALNDDYRGDLPYVEPVHVRDVMKPLRLPNFNRAADVDTRPDAKSASELFAAKTQPELPPGMPPLHVPPPGALAAATDRTSGRSSSDQNVTHRKTSGMSTTSATARPEAPEVALPSKAESAGGSSSHGASEAGRTVVITEVPLVDGASIHVVSMRNKLYVNSMEISILVPKFKKRDLLTKLLALKGLKYESLTVYQEECTALFEECLCENVPGTEENNVVVDRLHLFLLNDVAHIVQKLDPTVSSSLVSALEDAAQEFQKK